MKYECIRIVTLDGVGITQFSVIGIIHRNVGLKCFFFIYT